MQHLLISWVFSRQVWFIILQCLGLQQELNSTAFSSWWCQDLKQIDKQMRNGLNYLIIVVVSQIWKHHSDCVFNGTNVWLVARTILDKGALLCYAGANYRN